MRTPWSTIPPAPCLPLRYPVVARATLTPSSLRELGIAQHAAWGSESLKMLLKMGRPLGPAFPSTRVFFYFFLEDRSGPLVSHPTPPCRLLPIVAIQVSSSAGLSTRPPCHECRRYWLDGDSESNTSSGTAVTQSSQHPSQPRTALALTSGPLSERMWSSVGLKPAHYQE